MRCQLGSAALVSLLLAVSLRSAEPSKSDLNALNLEIHALQTLDDLELSAAQLTELAKLAQGAAQTGKTRKAVKASDTFQKTLTELRDALAKGDERAEELQKKIKELTASEKIQLDDEIEISPAARRRAGDALKLLKVRQLASLIAGYGDELPDPEETLIEALDKAHELKDAAWRDARDDVAAEVGWLIAGLDPERSKKVSDKVSSLLDRAHQLKGADFKKRRPELVREGHDVLKTATALEILRHIAEHDLAELLSNPRLPAAIDACQERLKK